MAHPGPLEWFPTHGSSQMAPLSRGQQGEGLGEGAETLHWSQQMPLHRALLSLQPPSLLPGRENTHAQPLIALWLFHFKETQGLKTI